MRGTPPPAGNEEHLSFEEQRKAAIERERNRLTAREAAMARAYDALGAECITLRQTVTRQKKRIRNLQELVKELVQK